MNNSRKKGTFILLALFLIIIIGTFIPTVGAYVLIEELCDLIVLWVVGIYIAVMVIKTKFKSSSTVIKAIIITISFCICIWFTKNMMLDLISGTTKTTLTNLQLSSTQAHTGIFSKHYYLNGTTEKNKKIRLEISADYYMRLKNVKSIVVEYYSNTGRVVKIST